MCICPQLAIVLDKTECSDLGKHMYIRSKQSIKAINQSITVCNLNVYMKTTILCLVKDLGCSIIPLPNFDFASVFLFSCKVCWGEATVVYTIPQQFKKEESEELRGERGQIKFIDLRFERGKIVVFGKGRRRQDIPLIARSCRSETSQHFQKRNPVQYVTPKCEFLSGQR